MCVCVCLRVFCLGVCSCVHPGTGMRVGPGTIASHGCATHERCMAGILKGRRHIKESYRCTGNLILLFKCAQVSSGKFFIVAAEINFISLIFLFCVVKHY